MLLCVSADSATVAQFLRENRMKTVIVSAKFQIAIPRVLCRQLNIQPGHKLKVRVRDGHLELTPELPMTAARGFLPGLDTQIRREKDRV